MKNDFNMTDSQENWQQFIDTHSNSHKVAPVSLQLFQNTPESWFCDLNQWQILRISGTEAATFLQGQISCDVLKLNLAQAQLAACVNLKGRIISNFLVLKASEQDFLILCPAKTLIVTQSILTKYAIFSKVTIEQDSSLIVAAGKNLQKKNLTESEMFAFSSSSLACDFYISSVDKIKELWIGASKQKQLFEPALFDFLLISAGIVFIQAQSSERFTPQEINFELVNGISFSKGCYTGQEVVARLHYRGTPKRRGYISEIQPSQSHAEDIDLECEISDDTHKSQGHILQTLAIQGKLFSLICISIQSYLSFTENPDENVLNISNMKENSDTLGKILSIQPPPYSLSKSE
jgi:folate-binding protein YgfZ